MSKLNFRKGSWSEDEDRRLKQAISHNVEQMRTFYGPQFQAGLGQSVSGFSWKEISIKVGTRSGKQCRERWVNHLCPGISKEDWTVEEESTLRDLSEKHPGKWVYIASKLPGRTQNQVKTKYRSLKRQAKRKTCGSKKRRWSEITTDSTSSESTAPEKKNCVLLRRQDSFDFLDDLFRTEDQAISPQFDFDFSFFSKSDFLIETPPNFISLTN